MNVSDDDGDWVGLAVISNEEGTELGPNVDVGPEVVGLEVEVGIDAIASVGAIVGALGSNVSDDDGDWVGLAVISNEEGIELGPNVDVGPEMVGLEVEVGIDEIASVGVIVGAIVEQNLKCWGSLQSV